MKTLQNKRALISVTFDLPHTLVQMTGNNRAYFIGGLSADLITYHKNKTIAHEKINI